MVPQKVQGTAYDVITYIPWGTIALPLFPAQRCSRQCLEIDYCLSMKSQMYLTVLNVLLKLVYSNSLVCHNCDLLFLDVVIIC